MSRRNRRQVSKTADFMQAPRSTEFNPDYSHVKRDLRRIGLLAGAFSMALGEWISVQSSREMYERQIAIERVKVEPERLKVNEEVAVHAWVNLGQLEPKDVTVQLYYGSLDSRGAIVAGETLDMSHCNTEEKVIGNVHEFMAQLRYANTGKRGLTIRVLPNHEDLPDPIQPGLIAWAQL